MNTMYLAVAILAVVAQAYSQCLPACGPGIGPVYAPNCGCAAPALVAAPAPAIVAAPAPMIAAPAPIIAAPAPMVAPTVIAPNSVAATLADTLSLLTVSSLLAETLPYGCGCSMIAPPAVYNGNPLAYGYVL